MWIEFISELCVCCLDPFAEANAEDSGAGTKEYVHIRIQQRNGRKSLTTVQGLKKEFSYNKILKDLKKEFCCNGTVVQDPELGQVNDIKIYGPIFGFDFLEKLLSFFIFKSLRLCVGYSTSRRSAEECLYLPCSGTFFTFWVLTWWHDLLNDSLAFFRMECPCI